ncbi:MAG TPA: hypothetical protein ENN28_03475 [Candidatus Uhrbacteria bacterium]|nr:hypothetical protein [Candidatus Uhrbacteria bacterium]
MSLRNYIILMVLATAACSLSFFAVIYFFDPFESGFRALFFFYTSLFLALIGTFSILGLFLRLIFTKDNLVFKKVIVSFRQSIWFAFLIIISLHMLSSQLLGWKNLIILVFAFTLIELFFISYKPKKKQRI